jgi:hypothetical protein
MAKIRYAEGLKVLPILAPADIAATATATEFIDMKEAHWGTFLVSLGNLTSDSTDTVTITVEVSTAASSGSEVAIPFKYRESAPVATDSMGSITTASSSGAVFTATDDAEVIVVDVDPQRIPSELTDGRFLRLVITPTSDTAICIVGVIAALESRYPGNTMNSAT